MSVRYLAFVFGLLSWIGCGSGNIGFLDVVGIGPGDGAGTALSGLFAVSIDVRSGACSELSGEEIPVKGTSLSFDVTVTQEDGRLEIDGLWLAQSGSVEFKGDFEVGGSDILSFDGETGNIQRIILTKGSFEDADKFGANGTLRFLGRTNAQTVNCSFTFSAEGIRK